MMLECEMSCVLISVERFTFVRGEVRFISMVKNAKKTMDFVL